MKKLLFLIVAVAGISIYSAQAQTADKRNAEVRPTNVQLNEDGIKVRTAAPDANAPANVQDRTVDKNSNAAPVSGTKNSNAIVRDENKVIINNEPVTRTKPVKTVDRSTQTPK